MFAQTGTELAFRLLPAPTGGDLLAILDRVMRRVARRLDREAPDDPALADAPPELFAQLQAEAATTWRSPATARRRVRGSDRLRAWCDGFSLHAGVVVPDHDREALERAAIVVETYVVQNTRELADATGGSSTATVRL